MKHGLLAVAEEQTAGRGRRGHAWVSPPGTGIWFSFLLKPEISPDKASMLTIVAAMAVSGAIREVTGLDAQIKWPNDIVVNKKKVCGMLTELSAELSCINYVVIGIGINANMKEFPDEIKDIASSLYIESGKQVKRAYVIKAGDLSTIADEYNAMLANAGKQVRIIGNDKEEIYTAVGINPEGGLVVKDDDGNLKEIRSGEVSVRGLYGYV